MKEPNWKDLKIDWKGTRRLRRQMAKVQKIKITINLDEDMISAVRKLAAKQGSPYQTYLNWLLRKSVFEKESDESRIDHLERELALIKRKLAA